MAECSSYCVSYDSDAELLRRADLIYDGEVMILPLCEFNLLKSKAEKYDDIQEKFGKPPLEVIKNKISALHTAEAKCKKAQDELKAFKDDFERKNYQSTYDLATSLYGGYRTYELQNHKKTGCGRYAQALMVADAITGIRVKEILQRKYPYKKNPKNRDEYLYKKYADESVYAALRVVGNDKSGIENTARLVSLWEDFPNVFSERNISQEMFLSWIYERGRKVANSYKSSSGGIKNESKNG